MARPKIGIFGALMALGGFLAVRYVQRSRAVRAPVTRELGRWENEGGALASPAMPSPSTATAASASPGAHGANGSAYTNGNGNAGPFPRS